VKGSGFFSRLLFSWLEFFLLQRFKSATSSFGSRLPSAVRDKYSSHFLEKRQKIEAYFVGVGCPQLSTRCLSGAVALYSENRNKSFVVFCYKK